MGKSQLAFVLSEDSLSAASIADNVATPIGSIIFEGRKDFQYKEQIQSFMKQYELPDKEYDEYSLSWFSPLSALVPMNIFGASNARDIYHACFTKQTPLNDIDYNRIPELSLVNVFDIPLWVKSLFVMRFPRIVLQQEGSLFLRGIFSGSTFKLGVHVVLHKQHFQLIVVRHNELKLYNTYESTEPEDVIYYLAFGLRQQGLFGEAGQLFLYESADTLPGVRDILLEKIKKIKELGQLTPVETENLHFKYQTTCV